MALSKKDAYFDKLRDKLRKKVKYNLLGERLKTKTDKAIKKAPKVKVGSKRDLYEKKLKG